MRMTIAKFAAERRWFLKTAILGLGLCAITLSAMAAVGRYSSVSCVRAVRVSSTSYDLYARASGTYQAVQFETRGAWGTFGQRLPDGTWKARLFGRPGMGWGARTIVNGKPDAVAYSTLP